MSELKFDPITGQATLDSIDNVTQEQIDVAIAQAKDIENLKSSPGYKLLEVFLNDAILFFSKKLLSCEEIKDVTRCQEIVKSYQSILLWVDKHIEISKQLQEQSISDQEKVSSSD